MMRKHLGKARYAAVVGLVALATVLFFQAHNAQQARARSMLVPLAEGALGVGLIRAGLDPDALAASGVSPAQTPSIVQAVSDYLALNHLLLGAADANWADLQRQCSQLERTTQSGLASEEQVAAYPSLKAQRDLAAANRQGIVDAVFAVGSVDLSQTQRAMLTAIRANRSWDLPIEFLVMVQSEADRVQLRECLANERISTESGEPADPEAQAFLAQCRGDLAVATATINFQTNLASVSAAWNEGVSAEGVTP